MLQIQISLSFRLFSFGVQNIPSFDLFDLLFILFTLEFETVDVPLREEADDLSVVKGGGAWI